MVRMKPKTAQQNVELNDQVIIEEDEFIARLENDMGATGDFENKDLPFMEVASKLNTKLPFSYMLALTNDTHCYGRHVESDS